MTARLRLDCHTHLFAVGQGSGSLSRVARRSAAMTLLRWRQGAERSDEALAAAMQSALRKQVDDAADVIDGAVVLAFDPVYRESGEMDLARTHYVVENDHVARLAATSQRLHFGASINPYRRDAIPALERAIAQGAVLVKWLPPTQGIDPSSPRALAFCEALAHHGVPLLTHTGVEHTLPVLEARLGDPALLEPALRLGVTVILAHAALPLWPWERSGLPTVRALMQRYEHCYADTAALAVPQRARMLRRLFADPVVAPRLVHGSDWPVETIPNPLVLGPRRSLAALAERNPLRRDVRVKEALGAPAEYWRRAASILRLASR